MLIFEDRSHPSLYTKKYLITFNDYFIRKTWVYFLVEKSKAFVVFKSFKICVEKKVNLSIEAYILIAKENLYHESSPIFVT